MSDFLCFVLVFLAYEVWCVFQIKQIGKLYKNVKKIERGVAFSTCISGNNIVCHFSPLVNEEIVLEEGDIFKM
jgi:methionine aminopeptidase